MPTILMVDDHAPTRAMMGKILGAQHYRVIEACNGEEGYARARAQRPDLILMDGMMPRLDGYEALSLLKADAATESIPVLMLTALDLPRERNLAMTIGAAGYIIKPVLLDELWANIRRLLHPEEVPVWA
jgi:DNA-binding response OmpR family regulator